jgi:hypothetical protein
MKNTALNNQKILQQLEAGSWPHLLNGQKWKKSSDSLKHLSRITKKLCAMGLPLAEAIEMMRNLYWCAYGDIQDMAKPREEKPKSNRLHFDEFEIMFRLNVADVTPEELTRDYEFYSNLYAVGGTIWWTNGGDGAGGGPLHNFLSLVRMDNNYAFGPTKKQRGWPPERLAEVDAVGVYKRKEPAGKLGQRSSESAKKIANSNRRML